MGQRKNVMFTPELVESLQDGQVFVFGSNLIGNHSGGASLMAMERFGAVWGQAEGLQGQCYAIPVDIRGEAVENVSSYMKRHIDKFLTYAKEHQELFFLVPKIGCGAAGFDEEFMAPFFKEAMMMENVSLPKTFVDILKSNEENEEEKIQRVFNLIILDESGSMATLAKQAVSGLNETFQTIKNAQQEHQDQQHFISFVTFNSARIRNVMNRQEVESDQELKWTDYRPDNCTPLFDAMGQSLNELKNHVADEDVVLVTIITDGYENASREFSGHDIKKLVAELKAKGWVFAYIGTNQDVDAVADDMGIRSRMCYDYSPEGAECMLNVDRGRRSRFYESLSRYGRSIVDEDYDYFSSDEKDNEESEKDADILQNVDDDPSSPECVDNIDEEVEKVQDEIKNRDHGDFLDLVVEEKEPKGFWKKVKNILKG